MLRAMVGLERPGQGSTKVVGKHAFAGIPVSAKRTKLQAIAKNAAPTSSRASAVLIATHLSDAHSLTISELASGQAAAAELIEPLASLPAIVLIDGQLDLLDPWALKDVLAFMRLQENVAFIVSTNRPDVMARADFLVVLRRNTVRFAGTTAELIRAAGKQDFSVTTENALGVRAICEPFEVSITQIDSGLQLQARDGQDLAAALLLEGYGDIKLLVSRHSTIEEAMLAIE